MALYWYSAMREAQKKTNSIASISQTLLREFESPIRASKLNSRIAHVATSHAFDRRQETALTSQLFSNGLHELSLKWPKSAVSTEIYCSRNEESIHPLEVALALVEGGFLCYQTALYWNELTDQVPHTYYVAKERPKTSSKSKPPETWDDFQLRDAFVKPASEHKKIAVFRDHKIILLDRSYTAKAGVEARSLSVLPGSRAILITNLERTLLDCASVPENAGGLSSVIDAFEIARHRLKLDVLLELYEKLDFKYPHWQRIGFLLKHFVDENLSTEWARFFGKPKNKFYLAKGYTLDWKFDAEFSIFYPNGILA